MFLITDAVQDLQRHWRVLFLAFLAGGGGNYAMQYANPPRPDPWTGTQAREQAAALRFEHGVLEARVIKLENQQIPPMWFKEKVDRLERKMDDLERLIIKHDAGNHP